MVLKSKISKTTHILQCVTYIIGLGTTCRSCTSYQTLTYNFLRYQMEIAWNCIMHRPWPTAFTQSHLFLLWPFPCATQRPVWMFPEQKSQQNIARINASEVLETDPPTDSCVDSPSLHPQDLRPVVENDRILWVFFHAVTKDVDENHGKKMQPMTQTKSKLNYQTRRYSAQKEALYKLLLHKNCCNRLQIYFPCKEALQLPSSSDTFTLCQLAYFNYIHPLHIGFTLISLRTPTFCYKKNPPFATPAGFSLTLILYKPLFALRLPLPCGQMALTQLRRFTQGHGRNFAGANLWQTVVHSGFSHGLDLYTDFVDVYIYIYDFIMILLMYMIVHFIYHHVHASCLISQPVEVVNPGGFSWTSRMVWA